MSTGNFSRRCSMETACAAAICAMDLRSMEVRTFPADAIIIATGANGAIFGKSTKFCGVHRIGAVGALSARMLLPRTASFIQVHPTCIPGNDKLRLMSESARGGVDACGFQRSPATVAIQKDDPAERALVFLEEWYPSTGNLVPRDIATRAIFKVVFELNLGIDGKRWFYLDLTHIDRKILDRKLEGILEIYEKFVATIRATRDEDFPPACITPWAVVVDFKQATKYSGNICRG